MHGLAALALALVAGPLADVSCLCRRMAYFGEAAVARGAAGTGAFTSLVAVFGHARRGVATLLVAASAKNGWASAGYSTLQFGRPAVLSCF